MTLLPQWYCCSSCTRRRCNTTLHPMVDVKVDNDNKHSPYYCKSLSLALRTSTPQRRVQNPAAKIMLLSPTVSCRVCKHMHSWRHLHSCIFNFNFRSWLQGRQRAAPLNACHLRQLHSTDGAGCYLYERNHMKIDFGCRLVFHCPTHASPPQQALCMHSSSNYIPNPPKYQLMQEHVRYTGAA